MKQVSEKRSKSWDVWVKSGRGGADVVVVAGTGCRFIKMLCCRIFHFQAQASEPRQQSNWKHELKIWTVLPQLCQDITEFSQFLALTDKPFILTYQGVIVLMLFYLLTLTFSSLTKICFWFKLYIFAVPNLYCLTVTSSLFNASQ